MLVMPLTSSRTLSGSFVVPLFTMSATFFSVLHWSSSMSTALIITAILGLASISFLAASSLPIADSAFIEHPRASPFSTMSDAEQTSDRASSLDARGSYPLHLLTDSAESLKLLDIIANLPGVVSVSSFELLTIIA